MARFGIALIACALLASSPSANAENAPSEDAVKRSHLAAEEARIAFNEGRWDDALRLLRAANDALRSPLYLYNMGRVLERQGLLRDAYDSYLAARTLLPYTPEVHRGEIDDTKIASRVVDLGPRLDRAWVVAPAAEAGLMQLEGKMLPSDAREHPVAPGRRSLCLMPAASGELRCVHPELVAARVVTPDLAGRADLTRLARLARLAWRRSASVRGLELDGVALLFDPRDVEAILVEPGTHRIEVEVDDGRRHAFTTTLRAGQSWDLGEVVAAALTVSAKPERKQPPPRSSIAPWVVIGIGVAAVVAGGILLASADGNRDDVRGAERDAAGRIVGVSQREAFALASDADSYESFGYGFGAGGIATVVGGATWLALDLSSP